MSDALAVITRVIAEHRVIRERIRLTGEAVNDIEALTTLQRAHAQWTQSSITAMVEKQNQMLQAISFMEEGLKNHFGYEEKYLPPLFGEILMKALLYEHHQISRQLKDAKATLMDIKLEGLEQRELLSKKSQIQQTTSGISQTIEEHAGHEEIILNMMRRALEEAE